MRTQRPVPSGPASGYRRRNSLQSSCRLSWACSLRKAFTYNQGKRNAGTFILASLTHAGARLVDAFSQPQNDTALTISAHAWVLRQAVITVNLEADPVRIHAPEAKTGKPLMMSLPVTMPLRPQNRKTARIYRIPLTELRKMSDYTVGPQLQKVLICRTAGVSGYHQAGECFHEDLPILFLSSPGADILDDMACVMPWHREMNPMKCMMSHHGDNGVDGSSIGFIEQSNARAVPS
jgi:hypothetical protein